MVMTVFSTVPTRQRAEKITQSQFPPGAEKPIGWHRPTAQKQKLTPFGVMDKYLDGEKITGWPSFHSRRILERVEIEGYEIRPSTPEVLAGAGLIRQRGIVDGPGLRRIRRGRGFS